MKFVMVALHEEGFSKQTLYLIIIAISSVRKRQMIAYRHLMYKLIT
jgi:hypothetical protein